MPLYFFNTIEAQQIGGYFERHDKKYVFMACDSAGTGFSVQQYEP